MAWMSVQEAWARICKGTENPHLVPSTTWPLFHRLSCIFWPSTPWNASCPRWPAHKLLSNAAPSSPGGGPCHPGRALPSPCCGGRGGVGVLCARASISQHCPGLITVSSQPLYFSNAFSHLVLYFLLQQPREAIRTGVLAPIL